MFRSRMPLEFEREQLSLIKSKYDEARIDAYESLPQKFVVESAFKAEKIAYPIRWLIVFSITLSALLLAVGLIIIFEKFPSAMPFKKFSHL